MKNANTSKLVLAIAAMAAASGACAAPTVSGTGDLAVSATIAPECAVSQNTAIAFANLTMLTGGVQSVVTDKATGTLNAICTNGTPTPMIKYASANTSGADFRLIGGTDATAFITYTLHQDATGAAAAVAYNTAAAHPQFTGTGDTQVLDLTAKILPAAKNGKKVQAYTDTITVTTTFGA